MTTPTPSELAREDYTLIGYLVHGEQPIASAPHDGTAVVVTTNPYCGWPVVARFNSETESWECRYTGGGFGPYGPQPKYWLPDAPTRASQENSRG